MSIAVSHLHKSYGKQQVLNDLSFSINSGEIVGFLGNNGAGKSTTMKIITGYIRQDAGMVEVCGIDVQKSPIQARHKSQILPYIHIRIDGIMFRQITYKAMSF